jgi:hypothetical protein
VFAELDRMLVDESADRSVVVTGGEGTGKTAIVAHWLATREAHGFMPRYFVQRQRADRVEPWGIARALAAQIEQRYPALRDPYARPEARLAELLSRLSARELVPRGARIVLVIDGLDDQRQASDLREVLALLPRTLPRGVRLLCAGRRCHPERDGNARWACVDLDDPSLGDDHEATVRAWWQREAQRLGIDVRLVERAVHAADGNLLHAAVLARHLAHLPPSLRRPEAIPRGLPALLASLWQRVAGDGSAVRALGILCAAREPLTLEQIGRIAGWSQLSEQRGAVHVARDLVAETPRGNLAAVYRPFHGAIRSYVIEQLGPRALRELHGALIDTLAPWPPPGDPEVRRYALEYGVGHRIAAGDSRAIHALASNVDFLEAKCGELGVDDVELGVRRAVEACLAAGHMALARELDDLARAIARESSALRHGAGASPIWNHRRQLALRAADGEARRAKPASDRPPTDERTAVLPERAGLPGPPASPGPRRLVSGEGGAATEHAMELDGHRAVAARAGHPPRPIRPQGSNTVRAQKPTAKHIILFLAANPKDTSRAVLQEECAAIERELQLAQHGDDFEFRSKWAVTVDEMARHLIALEPTIIHVSGQTAGPSAAPDRASESGPGERAPGARDAIVPGDSGIRLYDDHHGERLVKARALSMMIGSAAPSARVVVLNACYSDRHAEQLCQVVDCVVGVSRTIQPPAARSFAVAFYRALGHRRSVGDAVAHARATLAVKHPAEEAGPFCRTRDWSDADQIVL